MRVTTESVGLGFFQPQFHLLGQATWGYRPADIMKNFVGKSWDEMHGSIAAAVPLASLGQC